MKFFYALPYLNYTRSQNFIVKRHFVFVFKSVVVYYFGQLKAKWDIPLADVTWLCVSQQGNPSILPPAVAQIMYAYCDVRGWSPDAWIQKSFAFI